MAKWRVLRHGSACLCCCCASLIMFLECLSFPLDCMLHWDVLGRQWTSAARHVSSSGVTRHSELEVLSHAQLDYRRETLNVDIGFQDHA